MKFHTTAIDGAFLIEQEAHTDDRGSFARTWCQREFAAHGLDAKLVQCSLSANKRKGTLRGLHYSVPPHAEAKLVRCVKGAIYDVLLDLRRGSPTSLKWFSQTLSRDNGHALFVPEGVAHGFQTLEDETDVFYQMTEFFDPDCARGVRWDDPTFGIQWPAGPRILSEQDRNYPNFTP